MCCLLDIICIASLSPSLCTAVCEDGAVRLSLDGREPEVDELVSDEERRGRVEVCSGGRYVSVCGGDLWNLQIASVVCSQLGFSRFG